MAKSPFSKPSGRPSAGRPTSGAARSSGGASRSSGGFARPSAGGAGKSGGGASAPRSGADKRVKIKSPDQSGAKPPSGHYGPGKTTTKNADGRGPKRGEGARAEAGRSHAGASRGASDRYGADKYASGKPSSPRSAAPAGKYAAAKPAPKAATKAAPKAASKPAFHKPAAPARLPVLAEGRYFMYGRHAVVAALANPNRTIHRLVMTPAGQERLGEFPKTIPLQSVDADHLNSLVGADAVHQGIVAEVSILEPLDIEDVMAVATPDSLLLVLDQVTDPHNVGAILRSAVAFGVQAIITVRDHAAAETGAMAKAACGALELVPVVAVTNLVRALEQLKADQFWVVGLDGEATLSLHQQQLSGKRVLVLGAEGKGMRRLTAEACDLLARLPMAPAMESLNVSNAAAIALYELNGRK